MERLWVQICLDIKKYRTLVFDARIIKQMSRTVLFQKRNVTNSYLFSQILIVIFLSHNGLFYQRKKMEKSIHRDNRTCRY